MFVYFIIFILSVFVGNSVYQGQSQTKNCGVGKWIIENNECVCPTGSEIHEEACVEMCGDGYVLDDDLVCVAGFVKTENESCGQGNWVLDDDVCICPPGNEVSNGWSGILSISRFLPSLSIKSILIVAPNYV